MPGTTNNRLTNHQPFQAWRAAQTGTTNLQLPHGSERNAAIRTATAGGPAGPFAIKGPDRLRSRLRPARWPDHDNETPSGANTPHQSSKPAAARPCELLNRDTQEACDAPERAWHFLKTRHAGRVARDWAILAAFEPGSFGGPPRRRSAGRGPGGGRGPPPDADPFSKEASWDGAASSRTRALRPPRTSTAFPAAPRDRSC